MSDAPFTTDFTDQPPVNEIPPIAPEGELNDTLKDVLPQGDVNMEDVTRVQDLTVANFSESGFTDAPSVGKYIVENIPPEHLNGLSNLEYVNDGQKYAEGVMGMWVRDDNGDQTIEVYPHDDPGELMNTVAHEIGHNAEDNVAPGVMDSWGKLYQQSQLAYEDSNGESNEFVTAYAHANSSEDFAESYAYYINDPPYFYAVSPDKYDFLKNDVFNGKEFL